MTKQAEREYLSKLGENGAYHSLLKPFSNEDCGLTLASIGTVMALMPPLPAKILDLGCGGGWTSVFFAKYGYDVTGQDISEDMIDLARKNAEINGVEHKATFVLSDYEELAMAEEFDCAIFFDSLHHADDPAIALSNAYRSLKPGGTLITHEPGLGHASAPKSIEAMELYGVNEKDLPPSLLEIYGRAAGFRNIRVFPMQDTIQQMFYRRKMPSLWSFKGIRLAQRLLSMAFGRSDGDHSSIVLMTK